VQMQNNATPTAGTRVSISDTAPITDRDNLSACEILAATSNTPTYSISGTVNPTSAVSGAVLALTGAATGNATPDSSGNFSFGGLANGTYTVTPSKSGYTFSPTNQTVTVSGANVGGIAFTAQISSTG